MNVAIFVEGLTEEIFVRQLIENYFGHDIIEIKTQRLIGKRLLYHFDAGKGENKCIIINCSNDERTLSCLKDNYLTMYRHGWDIFIGLRDIWPSANISNSENMISKTLSYIGEMEKSELIKFHFAKMEIEAWFLVDYKLFKQIDKNLTVENILSTTKADLPNLDPELTFESPASFIKEMYLELRGKSYQKHEYQIEEIVYNMDWLYLCFDAQSLGKISFFHSFLSTLTFCMVEN